jgi:hypothetical protein
MMASDEGSDAVTGLQGYFSVDLGRRDALERRDHGERSRGGTPTRSRGGRRRNAASPRLEQLIGEVDEVEELRAEICAEFDRLGCCSAWA